MKLNKTVAVAFVSAFTLFNQTSAFAQQTATPVATPKPAVEEPKPVLLASPELMDRFQKICKANFVLSDKAKTACETNAAPKPNKAQTMFRNTGIGVEFNTLARQMKSN